MTLIWVLCATIVLLAFLADYFGLRARQARYEEVWKKPAQFGFNRKLRRFIRNLQNKNKNA